MRQVSVYFGTSSSMEKLSIKLKEYDLKMRQTSSLPPIIQSVPIFCLHAFNLFSFLHPLTCRPFFLKPSIRHFRYSFSLPSSSPLILAPPPSPSSLFPFCPSSLLSSHYPSFISLHPLFTPPFPSSDYVFPHGSSPPFYPSFPVPSRLLPLSSSRFLPLSTQARGKYIRSRF